MGAKFANFGEQIANFRFRRNSVKVRRIYCSSPCEARFAYHLIFGRSKITSRNKHKSAVKQKKQELGLSY